MPSRTVKEWDCAIGWLSLAPFQGHLPDQPLNIFEVGYLSNVDITHAYSWELNGTKLLIKLPNLAN